MPGLHDVVQRFDCLFDGSVVIEPVDLVEVHVIGAEAAQAVVDGVHDVLARKSPLVGIVAHRIEYFGGDDDAVARAAEIFQSAAQYLFAYADRIHVRGIEEIDAKFQRALDEGPALLLFKHPFAPLLRAVSHGAEANRDTFKPVEPRFVYSIEKLNSFQGGFGVKDYYRHPL